MTERPILFSAPMVRALLAGTKTQTRRVVKPADMARDGAKGPELWTGFMGWQPASAVLVDQSLSTNPKTRCPYGVPGDRLWVRETWGYDWFDDGQTRVWKLPVYRADPGAQPLDQGAPAPWRPSIHMPRALSRILLEVTDVRVERLQSISEADAIAEGCEAVEAEFVTGWQGYHTHHKDRHGNDVHFETTGDEPVAWMEQPRKTRSCTREARTAAQAYALLWDQINGAGSWNANPWVWAVSFTRVTP